MTLEQEKLERARAAGTLPLGFVKMIDEVQRGLDSAYHYRRMAMAWQQAVREVLLGRKSAPGTFGAIEAEAHRRMKLQAALDDREVKAWRLKAEGEIAAAVSGEITELPNYRITESADAGKEVAHG